MKILQILRYPDRVAIEYEVAPGYPQTFPPMASDDRCTWDNLHLLLPKEATEKECIALAVAMLAEEKQEQESQVAGLADIMDLANEVMKPSTTLTSGA